MSVREEFEKAFNNAFLISEKDNEQVIIVGGTYKHHALWGVNFGIEMAAKIANEHGHLPSKWPCPCAVKVASEIRNLSKELGNTNLTNGVE